jgi:DNA-binding NarL/FixJ family response regulator
MKRAPIRVLVADGDPLVCRALVRLLHDSVDVEVIATAKDEDEVLELAGQLHPAVALVDARTGRTGMSTARVDGIEVTQSTQSLCRQLPATRVIILGVYATMREQALNAGACRFVLKDCSRDTLVEAIRLAASGQCEASGTTDNPTIANALGLAYRHRTER